jgi:hypothetical protein
VSAVQPAAAPISSTATDALSVALVSLLGPWGALAAIAYKFGSPFVGQLIANSKLAADPTVAEWTKLDALIDVPGEVLIPPRAVPTGAAVPGPMLVPPKV